MVRVVPTKTRSALFDTTSGLELFIPAKRNFFLVAFLIFWIGGWTMGESFAIKELFQSDRPHGTDAFLLFWLGGWTLGGAFAIYTVLWILFGREHVTLRHDALVMKRELFSMGRAHEYDLNSVRNLRVSSAPFNPSDFRSALQFWGLGGGLVAFDYGASTVRFGASIDEAEAAQIVQRLSMRHSFPDTLPVS